MEPTRSRRATSPCPVHLWPWGGGGPTVVLCPHRALGPPTRYIMPSQTLPPVNWLQEMEYPKMSQGTREGTWIVFP